MQLRVLTPRSDELVTSPCNSDMLSCQQVGRVKKLIVSVRGHYAVITLKSPVWFTRNCLAVSREKFKLDLATQRQGSQKIFK